MLAEIEPKEKIVKSSSEERVRALFAMGAHFGYTRARRHPSTDPYIFGYKNRTAIIDLEKSLTLLDQAKDFISTLGKGGKVILWVGTKSEAAAAIQAAASSLHHPYVSGRWIGGTLTNWSEIRKRIERLIDLETKQRDNQFAM